MLRYFFYLLFLACFLTSPFSEAKETNGDVQDWYEIDRIGLYDSVDEGQLDGNLWGNYSQKEALEVLQRLPSRLSSAAYRDVVKRLLLSSSRPIVNKELDSPLFLTKRLELLIHYGLIDDARAVLEKIPDSYDFDNNIDMAIVKLKLALADGNIAPACLDVQASADQFRDMPVWRELTQYCRLRFGSSDTVKMSEVRFEHYPALKYLLARSGVDYDAASDLEILFAQADNRLFDEALYDKTARSVGKLPDLVVYNATDNRYASQTTYQCYIIEAAKRGLRDSDFIRDSYAAEEFKEDVLSETSGQVSLHPCDVAAFFYQKLDESKAEGNRTALLNTFLKTTESVPVAALLPFSRFLVDADINSANQWRAAAILAFAGDAIPDTFLPVAEPLRNIMMQTTIREADYIEWANVKTHEEMLEGKNIDIASPLYFLQILSGEFNKLKNPQPKNLYENIFSLTYEKKSLSLGIGFNGFMSAVMRNKGQAETLIRGLGLMAAHDINAYSVEDVAVILSTLQAYKLEKDAVTLAFEYLQ